MAETDAQGIRLMYAVTGLRDYFRQRPDVYVSGNLLIYYEEGNKDASVAPDVFVVIGVPNHPRPTYRVWEEGKVPDFVLEITSRHTRDEDEGPKRDLMLAPSWTAVGPPAVPVSKVIPAAQQWVRVAA